MPIKPADILQCADDLTKDTKGIEALCRTAVSRSYYAAFHDCLEWINRLPGESGGDGKATSGAGGVHLELARRLAHPGTALSEEQKTTSRKRGVALRRLHGDRVNADYKLGQSITPMQARNALASAKQIFALTA